MRFLYPNTMLLGGGGKRNFLRFRGTFKTPSIDAYIACSVAYRLVRFWAALVASPDAALLLPKLRLSYLPRGI